MELNLATSAIGGDRWEHCSKVINDAAHEIIGLNEPRKRNDWFDEECSRVTNEKNKAYKQLIARRGTRASREEYRARRTAEKKLHRKKKRQWENKKISELEMQKENRNSRAFFQNINQARAPFKPNGAFCRLEDGSMATEEKEILNRWTWHFGNLLNDETRNESTQLAVPNDDEMEPPDEEEIRDAINKMKNCKAPGCDNLNPELFKYGGENFIKELRELFLEIWTTEVIPDSWRKAIICPIFKKGDQLECSNYRGISLLNCAYKVFSNVLYSRLLPHAEREIGRYQCGFRKEKSTSDQMFSLRMILEKGREYGLQTHHLSLHRFQVSL
ncbi:uncharacterized protein [Rhodnius prolixus]|uniref:uncharacterized protein n=1 Tax=Rhodnius prolixus TaxID=13249 RepID=UPI003D1888FD